MILNKLLVLLVCKTMKKNYVLLLLFVLIFNQNFGQKLYTDKVTDTLSIENFGKKIELENDLKESERLNDILIEVCQTRKDIKYLPEKIKTYYENAYFSVLINKGYFENKRGNYKQEIAIYYQILKNTTSRTNNVILGFTYNAIGMSFAEIKEYKKSIYYCTKALKLQIRFNNISSISNIYDNLGQLYQKTNQLDKALHFFNKSIEYGLKSDNISILGNTYNNIGGLYIKQNKISKAISNLKKGIKIALKYHNNHDLSHLYFNLAEAYKKRGETSLYEKYKHTSFEYAESSKNLIILNRVGLDLYQLYKAKNNLNKALYYYEKSNEARETLEKEDNKNAILKADFKHETEKKQNQIKVLSQEKKIAELKSEQQTTLIFVLITLFISIGAVSYFLFSRYKINKQNELLKIELEEAQKTFEAEKKAAESELKALKSQMNPHFIFNALNGIQEQFMYGDKVIANEQMGNFTYLTRQILEVSGKTKITIAHEIEILTKYLELEKMRFDQDFEYTITLNDTINEDYEQIPPLLIQPFVENSIKHGLLHKKGAKKISIFFDYSVDPNQIICTIEDNGIGRKKAEAIKNNNKIKHNSFSTQSIHERLEIWNTNTEKSILYEDILDINQESLGTKVSLYIELK